MGKLLSWHQLPLVSTGDVVVLCASEITVGRQSGQLQVLTHAFFTRPGTPATLAISCCLTRLVLQPCYAAGQRQQNRLHPLQGWAPMRAAATVRQPPHGRHRDSCRRGLTAAISLALPSRRLASSHSSTCNPTSHQRLGHQHKPCSHIERTQCLHKARARMRQPSSPTHIPCPAPGTPSVLEAACMCRHEYAGKPSHDRSQHQQQWQRAFTQHA